MVHNVMHVACVWVMYQFVRWQEKLDMWVAWHLPRRVVYWAAIRLGAEASSRQDGPVPNLLFTDALRLWEGEWPDRGDAQ